MGKGKPSDASQFWKRYAALVDKDLPVLLETKIKASTLSSYKTENRFPRADEAVKIAKKLGVTVEELVDGTRPADWRPPENIVAIVDDLVKLPRDKQDCAAVIIHAILEHDSKVEPSRFIMPEHEQEDDAIKKTGA